MNSCRPVSPRAVQTCQHGSSINQIESKTLKYCSLLGPKLKTLFTENVLIYEVVLRLNFILACFLLCFVCFSLLCDTEVHPLGQVSRT